MTKKKPYFPNNVEALTKAPAELFESIEFDEFMEWKTQGWELPSSVACIIRDHNLRTGKVKEYVYERTYAAKNKCHSLMDAAESDITICNSNSITRLSPDGEEGEYYVDEDF